MAKSPQALSGLRTDNAPAHRNDCNIHIQKPKGIKTRAEFMGMCVGRDTERERKLSSLFVPCFLSLLRRGSLSFMAGN